MKSQRTKRLIKFTGLITAISISIAVSMTLSMETAGAQAGRIAFRGQEEFAETCLSEIGETMSGRIMVMAEEITADAEELIAAADPYRDRPDIDTDDWMYILANPWNEIGDYMPELATLERQQFD